ncbi:hypothetical protein SDC9_167167 [bioreactor metagenome]|uniref:Uncharacterized protein n=1 Tax=bioreactor metagenome TaxID=1076179 RepID=A0A645FZH9_9ZZZZ
MFILQVFLMGGAVFHTDALTFQVGKGFIGVFFRNHQRGVGIVRLSKRNLLATLRCDIHSGNNRIIFLEFQRGDQAIESVIGESTFCLHLFAQRRCQVDVKTDNLIAGVQ